MKAFFCIKYGEPEVIKMKKVTKPVPDDNEVCVKIFATAVTASDIFIRSSDIPFIRNYRNLINLQIKSLGKINLITGKNNTGKYALLETISIFLQKLI